MGITTQSKIQRLEGSFDEVDTALQSSSGLLQLASLWDPNSPRKINRNMTSYLVGCCRASRLSTSRAFLGHMCGGASAEGASSSLLNGRFFFSTTSTAEEEVEELDSHQKSKRQQFRETPVHPSIRRYIETIGVGIPNRRKKTKRMRNHLFDHIEAGQRSSRAGGHMQLPPPFASEGDPRKVVVIGSVSTTKDTLPTNKEAVPEVALAGRSNVGKSTLLNALLYGNQNRKSKHGEESDNLVRRHRRGTTPENVKLPKGAKAIVSDKPGETQKITFFQLSSRDNNIHEDHSKTKSKTKNPNRKLRLVDLPGYGFSFKPRNHDGFQYLLLQYLLERGKTLKRVLLLIDARHGFKQADIEFLQTMEEESYKSRETRKMPAIQIVLTKCDLVRRDDLARRVVHVRQELSDALRRETSSLPVLLVSARAGVGFNNVKNKRNGSARARGGVLELQKELAALVPHNKKSSRQ